VSVLIVDDSSTTRHSLRALLEGKGYRDVLSVSSGEEALGLLGQGGASANGPPVDVIIMDVEMPGLDGIETCRRLKGTPHLRDLPVLIVTGNPQEETLAAAFAAGASDFLAKPVQVTELLARLRSALHLKRDRDRCRAREAELLKVADNLKRMNEELQRLTVLDELTGISNRRFFNVLLEQEWGRAAREVQPLSLLMIDIDFFKSYNDHYGHPTGDECLRRVAGTLSALTRRPGDQVARYGGEEFVVLMPHTALHGATTVAETLRQRIEELGLEHASSPLTGRVTISLGAATALPERRSSPQSLVAAADHAVYEAKRLGRNRVHAFEGSPERALALEQGPHRSTVEGSVPQ
jgi:diguanylate cyclase (GGDEF)-like protein